MTVLGSINVRLRSNGQRIVSAYVETSGTVVLRDILAGRTPEEALEAMGTVFGICPAAQTLAAHLALCAARGQPADGPTRERLKLLNACETLRESLMLFALRFCRERDAAFEAPLVAAVRELVRERMPEPGTRQALRDHLMRGVVLDPAQKDIFFDTNASALTRTFNDLAVHSEDGIDPVPLALPPLLQIASGPGRLIEEGAYYGALSRLVAKDPLMHFLWEAYGNASFMRFLARLVETGSLLEDPLSINAGNDAVSYAPGAATSLVQCARGALYHRVELDQAGRIRDYEVVSPTEINAGPRFATFSRMLCTVQASGEEELRYRAGKAIDSYDPCLPYTLEVLRHA